MPVPPFNDIALHRSFILIATSVLGLFCWSVTSVAIAAPPAPSDSPISLWSGTAPDEKGDIGEEKDTSSPAGKDHPEKYVIRIGNVTHPTLTVYRPKKSKDTGAAIVVCPGGGYTILAMNLEGTEICQWLNSIGVTAILLKYRVPSRQGREKHAAALQDAQRALGIVRHRASEWGIDPHRIGILGFSAGGHLSALLSTNYATRTYTPVDDADKESCRPDFALLIYPAYLTDAERIHLAPEISVTTNTPPAFIVQTEDDPVHVENALVYSTALKQAEVPVELHIYAKGGHGYGLRPSAAPVSHWPALAGDWLASQGWLKSRLQ